MPQLQSRGASLYFATQTGKPFEKFDDGKKRVIQTAPLLAGGPYSEHCTAVPAPVPP
jgi:hypothetical protein